MDNSESFHYNDKSHELESWLLFCIAVAGKGAVQTRKGMATFFESKSNFYTPFEYIKKLNSEGELWHQIIVSKLGQWSRLHNAFLEVARKFNGEKLRTVTVEELESIPGIGPKTARFFVMTTQRDARHAALDTHILKYMKMLGYDVPKTTPQNRNKYKEIETLFLKLADVSGKTPTEFDYEIWKYYSGVE